LSNLQTMPVEQLEELAEALLSFTQISDLMAWLREQEK
ncbi:MAG: DUF4351 domain-containing protein, partial [Methylovulum sp.]|nr:DUF4351 domain-containing protein [Methylovulum sp.]